MSKELSEISWNVPESEYRADKAISYSTKSTFAREGIRGLKKILIDKVKLDTASIRHGSVVDTLLTDSENFNNIYQVSNFNKPSDLVKSIVDLIWENSDQTTNNLKKVNTDLMIRSIDQIGYGASNWKQETKINKIIEEGKEYFQLLPLTKQGKQLLHQSDYELALKCVETLKTHPYSSWIFDTSDPNIKIYYQLKFKINFYDFNDNRCLEWKEQLIEENTIRCMLDIVRVDYKNKLITPIDLKTTSKNEEDFELSIQDWFYDLQATEYSYIIRQVCKQDEYFKDFTITPFLFLPINKYSLNPQIYKYVASKYDLQETFIDYNNKEHKAWYYYLREIRWHIENQEFKYKRSTVINNGINEILWK